MLKNIKVYPEVKEKIDKYKTRGNSYNDILESFVNYFETTKIKPHEVDLSPVNITKKTTERVVKILKNIENKKLSKMLLLLDEIHDKVSKPVQKEITEITENTSFTDSEVAGLVSEIESLKDDKRKLTDEITALNGRISEGLEPEIRDVDMSFLELITSSVEELNNSKRQGGLGSDDFRISKSIYIRNIEQIQNAIKYR